jgi:glycosyltransferase involved in cell wall biosynthesis
VFKEFTNLLFPKESLRRKAVKKTLVLLHLKSSFVVGYYNTRMQQQQMFPVLSNQSRDLSDAPLISIIVPAFNTPERYINDLLYSIISQAYENWELILVNASSEPNLIKMIRACAERDERIKVIDIKNVGISENTNIGIKASSGEYIAFCDHDDTLDPYALYEVALSIIDKKAELIYTDEDKLSEDGRYYNNPHFKPDWSPDLLTHVNYINHLTVVKKSLLDKVGLLNPEMDGAQDYDLTLRLASENPKVTHIPKILYHWRVARNSTASDFSSKKNITIAGKTALNNYFERSGLDAEVISKEHQPGYYEVIFSKVKKISLVIMPFASQEILKLYTKLLINKTDPSLIELELLVPEGADFESKSSHIKFKTFEANKEFLKNAVNDASFERIIVISQIALPDDKDWASRLGGILDQKHIKVASPLIIQDGDKIDDCGLVVDTYGHYTHLFRGFSTKEEKRYTSFGNVYWVRNVDALTGGVAVVRKKQFKDFLAQYKLSSADAIFNFSSDGALYNTIYTEVVMDNCSIYFTVDNQKVEFFNKNLIINGDDFILYTSESVAMNILLRAADEAGLTE